MLTWYSCWWQHRTWKSQEGSWKNACWDYPVSSGELCSFENHGLLHETVAGESTALDTGCEVLLVSGTISDMEGCGLWNTQCRWGGLLLQLPPSRMLNLKSQFCHRGKSAKEKMLVPLCVCVCVSVREREREREREERRVLAATNRCSWLGSHWKHGI